MCAVSMIHRLQAGEGSVMQSGKGTSPCLPVWNFTTRLFLDMAGRDVVQA